MKYRRKSIVIDAVQLCWANWSSVCDLLGNIISEKNPGRTVDKCSTACGETEPFTALTIPTLEGDSVVHHGDWIVKNANDEMYVLEPGTFENTYEPIRNYRACWHWITSILTFHQRVSG